MKLSLIPTLALLFGTALTQSSPDLITAVAVVLGFVSDYTNYIAFPLYEGIILGLQANSDNEAHPCFSTFHDFEISALSIPMYALALGDSQ